MTEVTSFLIGGTHSGSGKTTISLGIMSALKNRGMKVQPFKCGPDFIDPTLHEMVTGRASRNLDLRMCGSSWCEGSFRLAAQGCDVAIVEGVMGLFDGGSASSGALASKLSIPVVLVVDVRSAAESVAAVVKGFENFNPDLNFIGVLFNRVGSKRHEELIRTSVSQNCKSRILGFIPRQSSFSIAERHLGLHMGSESPLNTDNLKKLADIIEKNVDLDHLVTYKKNIKDEGDNHIISVICDGRKLQLGIARDEAFCFYYQDNLDLFRKNGFDLNYFSPLRDEELPDNLDMLYFGGGYPELYGHHLSMNKKLKQNIKSFSEDGGVIYAECGGFMYLGDEIIDLKKKVHKMVGIFPMTTKMGNRLNRLGYRDAELTQDCPLGKNGEILYGHEFHYSEIVNIDPDVEKIFRLNNGQLEGYRVDNVLGGYVHLHFGNTRGNIGHLYRYINNMR